MKLTMLYRMLLMWRALSLSFNIKLTPIFTIIGFLFLHLINSIGFALDHIFFPQIRKLEISNPIVIVGNPRSGTTFLQRFLVENGLGAGMRIWKMLYPSLTLQKLIKPILPFMEKISPARYHTSVIHDTSLSAIETDDPALMFRYFDGLFVYGFFLAWAQEDMKHLFDQNYRDTSKRDFTYLEKMWIRNLISEKREQIISKFFSLAVRIPQFLENFPDAKILYMIRDPLATVPSCLSLITSVLQNRFGFWNLSKEDRQRYIDRIYDGLLDLSLSFHKDFVEGKIEKGKVMVIKYDHLMNNFENLMIELLEFIEESPSENMKHTISVTAGKQRRYKSEHEYELEKYRLTEAKIRSDFASIYETFLN